MTLSSNKKNLHFSGVSRYDPPYARIYGIDTFHMSILNSVSITFQECDVELFYEKKGFVGTQLSENVESVDFESTDYRKYKFADNISDLNFKSIFILEVLGDYNVRYNSICNCEDDYAIFYFHDVEEVSCDAIGRLAFSDSPEEKVYEVDNKSVSYKFKNAEGYVDIVQGGAHNVQLFSSGCVYSMEIAKYDLFPSFRNWYYNNLYIAPLTLLSIVIASIALIMKKRE